METTQIGEDDNKFLRRLLTCSRHLQKNPKIFQLTYLSSDFQTKHEEIKYKASNSLSSSFLTVENK